MQLYTKDLSGKEVGVGTNVIMSEPHHGRRLVKGLVVGIKENGVLVRFHDMVQGLTRVAKRKIDMVTAE